MEQAVQWNVFHSMHDREMETPVRYHARDANPSIKQPDFNAVLYNIEYIPQLHSFLVKISASF
jgi:hypothetical protein